MECFKPTRGFSVLEVLIAMAILVMVFGASLILIAGNQTAVVDSETNSEALNISQGLLENAQALARKDFNLVNPLNTVSADGFYTSEVGVKLSDDYLMKTVTATTTWPGQYGRNQYVALTTLVANFSNTVGANTCDSTVRGNWSAPEIVNSTTDFETLATVPGPITDLDVFQGRLYVTADVPGTLNLFVFDITDPANPTPDYPFLDTDPGGSAGLGALSVIEKTSGGVTTRYALVANRSSITKQFQVIDLENMNVAKSIAVPGLVAGTCTSNYCRGNSMFYKDGYAYLGLTATNGQGSEFNVIDVHDTVDPAWRGAVTSNNHDVNAIFVKEGNAYMASPDTNKLSVIDVGDPINPAVVEGFPGTGNTGKSVHAVGDTLYLGTTAGGARYEAIDGKNPTNLVSLGIQKSFSSSVDGIIVRDNLAFVLTKSALEIINATSTASVGSLALPSNASTNEPTFDCEGNYLYIGAFDSGTGKSVLYVVGPDS